jgi:hypothetical protein
MDRDMVNCLHYLYQGQPVTNDSLNHTGRNDRLFWCGPDTLHPLKNLKLVDTGYGTAPWQLGPGIFSFIKEVEMQLDCLPTSSYTFGYPFSRQLRHPGAKRPAFLAISYAPEFAGVKAAVLAAADQAGFECEVTGDLSSPARNIVDHVWKGIRKADVMVADITGNNPNVFYEVGLAHALGKDVILISQDVKAPFDIANSRREDYSLSSLDVLTAKLTDAFNAVTPRYPHEDPALPA